VGIVATLGARRRELRTLVGERLRLLDERADATQAGYARIEERLASIEGRMDEVNGAHRAKSRRRGLRRGHGNAALHQLGSALIYVGSLLVLWVVLLEVGLALGLT
jgi:hypothetical protein